MRRGEKDTGEEKGGRRTIGGTRVDEEDALDTTGSSSWDRRSKLEGGEGTKGSVFVFIISRIDLEGDGVCCRISGEGKRGGERLTVHNAQCLWGGNKSNSDILNDFNGNTLVALVKG